MKFFIILGLIGFLLVQALPYKPDSGVINLTKDTFAKEVFSSEHVWLVEFYAPWCGHCKALAPEWEKLAKSMKGILKIGAVNCDEEKELGGYFQIKGFPTIKLFGSKLTKTPDGKGFHKVPEDYNGARSASAIANFGVTRLPNFVTGVTSKNIDTFLSQEPELAKVLLFTDKKETPNLYKALAVDYHYALSFGEVRSTETEIVKKYLVDKFPSVIVINKGEEVHFTQKLSHESLFQFLLNYAKQPSEEQTDEAPQAKKPEETVFQHNLEDEVVKQEDFDQLCRGTRHTFCFMAFLDPTNAEGDELKKQLAELKKVDEKYSKQFRFLWLDAQKQTQYIETFQMYSGFPTAILYNHKKSAYVPFVGSFNEEAISEFLEKVLFGKGKPVKIDSLPPVAAGPKDEL